MAISPRLTDEEWALLERKGVLPTLPDALRERRDVRLLDHAQAEELFQVALNVVTPSNGREWEIADSIAAKANIAAQDEQAQTDFWVER